MLGVSGLASGMDTTAIIDSMIAVDRRSTVLIEQRREKTTLHREAVNTLNMRMLQVDLASTSLRRSSTFNAKQVTSADESVVSATALSRAGAGTYQVSVDQLAQSHQVSTTQSIVDHEAALFSGSFSVVTDAGSVDVDLGAEPVSLQGLSQAINNAGAGLSASIVDAGGQGDDYRLVVQGLNTGTEHQFTFDATGGNAALQDLLGHGETPAHPLQVLQTGQDSAITVTIGDPVTGLQINGGGASNTVEDLVDGVTFTAQSLGATTVTIDNDTASVGAAITEFVDALNGGLEYYRANATYDAGAGEAGILFGDSDIRSALDGLNRVLISGASGDHEGTVRTLSALGIDFNGETGLFEVDAGRLQTALDQDIQGVSDLFVGDGFGVRIRDAVSRLTHSVDGVLANKDRYLGGEISRMGEQIETMDTRLEQRRARYEAQFLQMEKLMAQFQSQEQFINQQIDAFSNLASSRSSGN